MKFEIVFPGKTREAYLARAIEDYRKRLSRFVKVDLVCVREFRARKGEEKVARRREGKELLGRIAPGSVIVALDPRGEMVDSEGLARRVTQWQESGAGCVSFLVGGVLGLDRIVTAEAHWVMSLSSMTFTHEIARFLLLEQLYRAFAINANTGYHR